MFVLSVGIFFFGKYFQPKRNGHRNKKSDVIVQSEAHPTVFGKHDKYQ